MTDDGDDLDKSEFVTFNWLNWWVSIQTRNWCLTVVIHTAPLSYAWTEESRDDQGPLHL